MRHKCLALFIVFVLFLTISTAVLLAEFKVFLSPATITQTLNQSDLYENLPALIEETTSKNTSSDLQAKVLTLGLVKSLDPQMIKVEVEKNIQPFFDFIHGQTTLLNVSFDLRSLKQNLELNLPSVLSNEMMNLPVCENGATANVEPKTGLPSCIPAGSTPSQLEQSIQTSGYVKEITSKIPDIYNLNQAKNIDEILARLKLTLKIIDIIFYSSIILSLLLIGSLVYLGRQFWPAILRWVGLGLVLPGGLLLIFNLLVKSLPQFLSAQIGHGLDPQIVALVNPLIIATSESGRISLILSGLIFAFGLILIILSYVLPHPPEAKPEAKPSN